MDQITSSKRILLIDDDPVTNLINKKLINREFDYVVNAYVNAKEALNYINNQMNSSPEDIPDIIFLDINMPIMDGWQFLEEFQKFPESVFKKCKIFMLTSSIDRSDIEKSKKYKIVADFISKP